MRKFLIPLLLLCPAALAQSPSDIHIGSAVPVAPFLEGGRHEDPIGITSLPTGYFAFTRGPEGTLITPVNEDGRPDFNARKTVLGSDAVAGPFAFWTEISGIYAATISPDATLVVKHRIAAPAVIQRAAAGTGTYVLTCTDAASPGAPQFALVLDSSGTPLGTPIAMPGEASLSRAIVDPTGFAVIVRSWHSDVGDRFMRFANNGAKTADVPIVGRTPATAVWTNGIYKIVSYSFDHANRVLLEEDVTIDGAVTPAKGIVAEPNAAAPTAMGIAKDQSGFILVVEQESSFTSYRLNESLTAVLTRRDLEPHGTTAGDMQLMARTFGAVMLFVRDGVVYVTNVQPETFRAAQVVSHGALDQIGDTIAGTPNGAVAVWHEIDRAIDRLRIRAARVSKRGDVLDAVPLQLAFEDPADVPAIARREHGERNAIRHATLGDDVLFLWDDGGTRTLFGHEIRGAIVHASGLPDPIALAASDELHLDDVAAVEGGYLVIATRLDCRASGPCSTQVEAIRLSRTGATAGAPRVINRTSGNVVEAVASDGTTAIVVLFDRILLLSSDGAVVSDQPHLSRPSVLVFGSDSYLFSDGTSLSRLTRSGIAGASSSAYIAAITVPVKTGWLTMETSAAVGCGIADTDPLIGTSCFYMPPGVIDAATETPDTVALLYSGRDEPPNMSAGRVFVRMLSISEVPRRHAVVSR